MVCHFLSGGNGGAKAELDPLFHQPTFDLGGHVWEGGQRENALGHVGQRTRKPGLLAQFHDLDAHHAAANDGDGLDRAVAQTFPEQPGIGHSAHTQHPAAGRDAQRRHDGVCAGGEQDAVKGAEGLFAAADGARFGVHGGDGSVHMEHRGVPAFNVLQRAKGEQRLVGEPPGGIIGGQHGVGRRFAEIGKDVDLCFHVAFPQCGERLIACAAEANDRVAF